LKSQNPKIIYIYTGRGTSKIAVAHTVRMFYRYASDRYIIRQIKGAEVQKGAWTKNAKLFVIPGGADRPYVASIKARGISIIRQYVENGGTYLGICAGSYFAGRQVQFAMDADIEVNEARTLGFFPGIVRGPTLAPFSYKNRSGARVARLFGPHGTYKTYYEGGGHFVDAHQMPNVEVLFNYSDTRKCEAAIVECLVGKGKAILSGAHFEVDANKLDEDDSHLAVIDILKRIDSNGCLVYLLLRLGI